VRVPRPVERVESVRQGALEQRREGHAIGVELPPRDTDMLKLYWAD